MHFYLSMSNSCKYARDWVNYAVSSIYSKTPFVRNRQVIGLDRLNSLKFTILGLFLMFSLHKISGFFRIRFKQVSLYLRRKQSYYCFIAFFCNTYFPKCNTTFLSLINFNMLFSYYEKIRYTVKPANVATTIKQSSVFK